MMVGQLIIGLFDHWVQREALVAAGVLLTAIYLLFLVIK
jgi:hypothetical protein